MGGPRPRPGILRIGRYVGGGAAATSSAGPRINVASNESALGPSPAAVAAYRGVADDLLTYPDGDARALREALGRKHGLDPERIVCGAGSDELLALVGRAYAGPGDEVICSEHGFLMYPIITHSVGADAVVAPERDLTTDVTAILERVTDRTRLVFLANPNNPTGTLISSGALAQLHAGLPPEALLVLDAAYAEFVQDQDYDPGVALVDKHDNVVMVRTFSKVYGLAGLRVGWMYCPADVADAVNRIRSPFNVTSGSQAAALAALGDAAHTERAVAHNNRVLPWFVALCAQLGVATTGGAGNFVLLRFPSEGDADAAFAFLLQRGILTRRMVAYGLANRLRVSIGLEEDMQEVVTSLQEFLAQR